MSATKRVVMVSPLAAFRMTPFAIAGPAMNTQFLSEASVSYAIGTLFLVLAVWLFARWLTDDKRQFEPDEHSEESVG